MMRLQQDEITMRWGKKRQWGHRRDETRYAGKTIGCTATYQSLFRVFANTRILSSLVILKSWLTLSSSNSSFRFQVGWHTSPTLPPQLKSSNNTDSPSQTIFGPRGSPWRRSCPWKLFMRVRSWSFQRCRLSDRHARIHISHSYRTPPTRKSLKSKNRRCVTSLAQRSCNSIEYFRANLTTKGCLSGSDAQKAVG